MRRERVLLLLGIWVALLPYLGFPLSWKNILFTLSGLGLIYLSYKFNKDFKNMNKNEKTLPINIDTTEPKFVAEETKEVSDYM